MMINKKVAKHNKSIWQLESMSQKYTLHHFSESKESGSLSDIQQESVSQQKENLESDYTNGMS